jgi:endonuclease YncB( thermonuclease family)
MTSNETHWLGDLTHLGLFDAKCSSVYDGDTITLYFEYYKGLFVKAKCRLVNIDCAEIKSKDNNEKEFAIKTREIIKEMILDKHVKIRATVLDKFGRLLITVYTKELGEKSLNDWIVENGYGYEYNGKCKKKQYSEWKK